MKKRTFIIISTIVVMLIGSYIVASAVSDRFRNKTIIATPISEQLIIQEKMANLTLRFSDLKTDPTIFKVQYMAAARQQYRTVTNELDRKGLLPKGYKKLVLTETFEKEILRPMWSELCDQYVQEDITLKESFESAYAKGLILSENVKKYLKSKS